jgi:hypothetical protein
MATNLGHDDVTITLDELYANNTVEQLLPMDELLKHWRQVSRGSAKNINARGAFYMLQTQQPAYIRQKSFGNTPGAQFPEATNSKYTTMNLSAIVDEATLQWDGNVEDQNDAALKQKPAKDLDYIERELEGAYEHYARQHARQLWGDRTNELARVSAINTGTFTVTCNNAGNLFNVQLLEQGMLIEIRDSTGATVRGYFRIQSVYRPTKTFIIDSTYVHDSTDTTAALAGLGIVNNDRIYPKSGKDQGWPGVDYLIATSGAFQSLADRTIHDHLTGVSIDASARAISAALMRRLRSARRNRRYGKKSAGKFYASSQIDGYEGTAFATQKYGQTTQLDMGYNEDELKFDGKSFEWDYYIAKNKVYEADLSAIDRFELREYKPIKMGGSYIHLAPGVDRHYDKKNVYLKGVGTIGCPVPAAVGGVLTNLSTAGLALGDD